MENNKLLELLNDCLNLNHDLLILSNNLEFDQLSLLDYYAFQGTNYAISLIHSIEYCKFIGLDSLYVIRAMIETITMMKMFLNNKIDEESIELMKEYNIIANYEIYKDMENFDFLNIDLKALKEAYKEVCSNYKDVINIKDGKTFKSVLSSKLPFLKERFSFNELIKEHYNDEMLKAYIDLSAMVHFNNLEITFNYFKNVDVVKYLDTALNDFKTILYDNYDMSKVTKTKYNHRWEDYYIENNKDVYEVNDLVSYEEDCLADYIYILDALGDQTLKGLASLLSKVFYSVNIDYVLGFKEMVKIKLKPIIEVLVLMNYIIILKLKNDSNALDLYELKSKYLLLDLQGLDNEEVLKQAYEIYKDNFESDIKYETFTNVFKKLTGFIPRDKDKKVRSITSLVNDLIDEIYDKSEYMNEDTKLDYKESIYFGHANSFLIACPSGAFQDCLSVVIFIDQAFLQVVSKTVKLYPFKNKEQLDNKRARYDLKKLYKELKELIHFKVNTIISKEPTKIHY